jgi:hypothetical protein
MELKRRNQVGIFLGKKVFINEMLLDGEIWIGRGEGVFLEKLMRFEELIRQEKELKDLKRQVEESQEAMAKWMLGIRND